MKIFKSFERLGKSALTFVLKLFVKQKLIPGDTIITEDIENILIVRQDRRVGNLILTTPLVENAAKIFSKAKIDIIVAKDLKVLIEDNPFINEIYSFDHKSYIKNPFKFFKLISSLKKNNYNLAIESSNPQGSSFLNGFITYLTKIKYRIGFGIGNGSIFTNVHINAEKSKQYYEQQQNLVNFLSKEKTIFKPNISSNQNEIKRNRDVLFKKYKLQIETKLIGLWIGARGRKKWDIENFKTLYGKISSELKHSPILSFGIEEQNQFNDLVKSDLNIIKFSDLKYLKLFISSCDVFVCGDTGPLHLSFALGVPTIGVFFEDNYITYGYANETNNYIIRPNKNEVMINEIITSLRNIIY